MTKNLDDDFDELMDPQFNEDNTEYAITPKGLMLIALYQSKNFAKYVNPDNTDEIMNIADEIWAVLENYTRKNYGHGDNAGGIVFDMVGGEFVSIQVTEINDDDDDETDD